MLLFIISSLIPLESSHQREHPTTRGDEPQERRENKRMKAHAMEVSVRKLRQSKPTTKEME